MNESYQTSNKSAIGLKVKFNLLIYMYTTHILYLSTRLHRLTMFARINVTVYSPIATWGKRVVLRVVGLHLLCPRYVKEVIFIESTYIAYIYTYILFMGNIENIEKSFLHYRERKREENKRIAHKASVRKGGSKVTVQFLIPHKLRPKSKHNFLADLLLLYR